LKLEPFSGVMLQAIVPPGHHTIELSYWPSAFTVGLGLAVGSAVGLAIALVTTWVRRRRKRVSAPGTAEPAPA
jgi:ABC-type nitrate/sulfonate/bicarbonate transport system permease component